MLSLQTSIEILPQQLNSFISDFDSLDSSTQSSVNLVFVTHIQGKPYVDVVDCCERLACLGFFVVPHLAARNIVVDDNLEAISDRLNLIGISGLLLLGGDNPQPECYVNVQQLLQSGLVETITTDQLYFAAFPGDHPHCAISEDALEHIKQKCNWAVEHQRKPSLISQISFDGTAIFALLDLLRENNINAPLIPGCAGAISIPRMIKLASSLNIRQVMSFTAKHNLTNLITRYKFDNFAEPLVESGRFGGLHVFPFGNYAESLRSLYQLHSKFAQFQELA